MSRLRLFFAVAGAVILGLTVVIPVLAILTRSLAAWQPPAEGFTVSSRQAMLMAKTVGLALAGTAGAMLLSLPGAFCAGRITRPADKPWLLVALVLPLLLPPMVYAFGWQRIWPAYQPGLGGWLPSIRCIWIWSSWAWPIPALIIGSGWSRIGRAAYESAILVAPPRSAFLRAVLPSLSRHILVAGLVLFILFMGEYSVPHANGLMVIATELLWVAQNFDRVDVLWLSIIPIATTLTGLLIVRKVWPTPTIETSDRPRGAVLSIAPILIVVGITAVAPIVTMAARPTLINDLAAAWSTYHYELIATPTVCLGVGVSVTLVGIAPLAFQRFWPTAIAITILFGILPGALVGEAMLSAYLPTGWLYQFQPFKSVGWWIYNDWPLLVLGLTARFAWIGVLAAWVANGAVGRQLISQSAVDGADAAAARFSIALQHHWPTLLAGTFLAAAMAMAEVATTDMVAVPALPMISRILIEKFHRFETGMLVSLSLWMVASALPGAILISIAAKRRN